MILPDEVCMNGTISVSLVCCDDSPQKLSQVVAAILDASALDQRDRVWLQEDQLLPAGQAKEMHLAVADESIGKATFLQQIHEGGFFVYVGDPSCLQEHWFGPGTWVAFNDDDGLGHASKVGPNGCKRTMRILIGHFQDRFWPPKSE